MIDPCTSALITPLAWTLVHFVWQGFLVAIVFRLLYALMSIRSPNIRYAHGLLALSIMAICPVMTFTIMYQRDVGLTDAVDRSVDSSAFASAAAVERGTGERDYSAAIVNDDQPREGISRVLADSWLAVFASSIQNFGPLMVIMWMLGVMASGLRLLAGYANIVSLRAGRFAVEDALLLRSRELASRLGMRTAEVFASHRIHQAAVVGFWRPVVLLPASWITSMPADLLEAVIAHELAHIRRHDVWVNLLQRLVETTLFYHPAVWWISNRIRVERELCCDELAVNATQQRCAYALALEHVGRLQTYKKPVLAMSFKGERKMSLLKRVDNVLRAPSTSNPEHDSAWWVGLFATALPVIVLALSGLLVMQGNAMAQRREGDPAVEREKDRQSPEAAAGPRRLPEGDARRDNGPNRRNASEKRERSRPTEADLGDFKPQTDREAALLSMIQQLQREVAQLRRDVSARRDSEGPKRGGREGDGARLEDLGRSSGWSRYELSERWQSSKGGQVFLAYDKNADGIVSLEEWLAMTNGNINDERRELQTRRFKEAEPSGDGKFTPNEFIYWYSVSRIATDRDSDQRGEARTPNGSEGRERRGDGDGERTNRGTRERE